MADSNKWDYSEDDEDLIMEEGDMPEEEDDEQDDQDGLGMDRSPRGKSIDRPSHHPRFNRQQQFDLGSPSWSDGMEEKGGDSVAVIMQMEKTIVHHKFYNAFDDDFDEDDLA